MDFAGIVDDLLRTHPVGFQLGPALYGSLLLVDRSSVVTKSLLTVTGNYEAVKAGWVKFVNPETRKQSNRHCRVH